jgi:hypothetical protein
MAAHTIHFPGGLRGPEILIGLDVGSLYAAWGGPPATWNALIDTGSTSTVISPAVRTARVTVGDGMGRVRPWVGPAGDGWIRPGPFGHRPDPRSREAGDQPAGSGPLPGRQGRLLHLG